MKSHWQMFAAYNTWANRRLCDHAARLSDEDYWADRGAFFKSVHGTLNHLLVTDRIWMARFTGSSEPPPRLDTIVCDRFEDLRAARVAEDARIVAFIDGLDEADFSGTFSLSRCDVAGRIRAGFCLGAGPFLQSSDASSRPGPLPPDRLGGRGAGTRFSLLSARNRGRRIRRIA